MLALAPAYGAPGARPKPHERRQFGVLYVYGEASNGGEKRRIATARSSVRAAIQFFEETRKIAAISST
jgi:hypothetical protein